VRLTASRTSRKISARGLCSTALRAASGRAELALLCSTCLQSLSTVRSRQTRPPPRTPFRFPQGPT
jgi:hypothetical protein